MLGSSLLLLLIAAVLHAVANALIKHARSKLAFSWWMLCVFSLVGLPIWFLLGRTEPVGWLIVLISGLLEAFYFVTLTRSYSLGDLSQVYPIARGSAPLLTLVWATLFLSERPSPGGLLGIFLVVSGLYLVNLPSLADWKRPLAGFKQPAARWAVVTGALISSYSTVDKVGVKYFDPLMYLYLILFVAWIALMPVRLNKDRRAALVAELQPDSAAVTSWQRASRPLSVVAAAALGTGAYTLVLTALRLSPVSYVSPVREVSVVIGAWIGVKFLGESGGLLRVLAAVLVAAGIIVIAVAG
jgi:drug/metabolite transporter (DMT)-like permease